MTLYDIILESFPLYCQAVADSPFMSSGNKYILIIAKVLQFYGFSSSDRKWTELLITGVGCNKTRAMLHHVKRETVLDRSTLGIGWNITRIIFP